MNSNWSYCPETHNSGQNWWFFVLCDIEIWRMTLKNNRAPLLCYIKLCGSFQTHWWIPNLVTVLECSIRVKMDDFFSRVTSKFYRWRWEKNRAPLLCYFKLCASFRSHWWIQTGVTVRKRPIWVKIGDFLSCVTSTFDLWPWPFAWTSGRPMVISPENFVMIRWWEHSEKGETDGQTDRKKCSISCLVAAKKRNSAYLKISKQNPVSVKKNCLIHSQFHGSTCRIRNESQGCAQQFS